MKRSLDQSDSATVAAAGDDDIVTPDASVPGAAVPLPDLSVPLPSPLAVEQLMRSALGALVYNYRHFISHNERISWAHWTETSFFRAAWEVVGEKTKPLPPSPFLHPSNVARVDQKRFILSLIITCGVNSCYHHYGSYEMQVMIDCLGIRTVLTAFKLPRVGDPASGLFRSSDDYAKVLTILEKLNAMSMPMAFITINFKANDAAQCLALRYHAFWTEVARDLLKA